MPRPLPPEAQAAARILAIDPGSEKSGVVGLCGKSVSLHRVLDNAELVEHLFALRAEYDWIAIEVTKPFAMTSRRGDAYFPEQLLHTAVWSGRFHQAFAGQETGRGLYVDRREVKYQLLGSAIGKDRDVREALISLWGGRDRAVGGKRCTVCKGKGWVGRNRDPCDACDETGYEGARPPGPLHGVKSHEWAALGVAVIARDVLAGRIALRFGSLGERVVPLPPHSLDCHEGRALP